MFLINSLYGCDQIYRLLHEEGAEEKEIVGEVLPFEKNPTVLEIQTLLKLYGYNPGKPDGVLGLRTREAIARFQRENGLKETRFADQETWAKLHYFVTIGLVVDGEVNVLLMQQVLEAAGFDPGVPDGKFGRKTTQAVKDFQKAHQLKVDGKVGFKTLLAMSDYIQVEFQEK